jgi:hypothetical protein
VIGVRVGEQYRVQVGQAAERNVRCGLSGPLGGDQAAQQGAYWRALVGEHPDISLGAGQGEGIGQGVDRACLLAVGRQGERLQRAYLDDAASPALGDRRGVQPFQ